MTRALIVTNPAAGRSAERHLEAARRRLVAGGLAVEVARTAARGDAERIARAAVQGGVDLLIAHGGDGTVMEVAAALIGSERPLGLLPAGTGNLLAGNLGLGRSPRAAAAAILGGRVRSIDVGRLEGGGVGRYFAVAAGAGFDAELMRRTAQPLKRAFGMAAYLTTAVGLAANITRAAVRLETDAGAVETTAATVLVANCGELIPGILSLDAGIACDDGLLDVAVLDASSLADVVRVAWRLLRGRAGADPGVRFLKVRSVAISAAPALPVQADGEAAGRTPMSITVVPGALRVLAPARG